MGSNPVTTFCFPSLGELCTHLPRLSTGFQFGVSFLVYGSAVVIVRRIFVAASTTVVCFQLLTWLGPTTNLTGPFSWLHYTSVRMLGIVYTEWCWHYLSCGMAMLLFGRVKTRITICCSRNNTLVPLHLLHWAIGEVCHWMSGLDQEWEE